MTHAARFALASLTTALVASALGCAVDTDVDAAESPASLADEPAASTTQASTVQTYEDNVAAQAMATRALAYVLGGSGANPLAGDLDPLRPEALNSLRAYFQDGHIRIVSAHRGTVQLLPALIVTFGCYSHGTAPQHMQTACSGIHFPNRQKVAVALHNAQAGLHERARGAGTFFLIPASSTATTFQIDPSVARLTANLTGSSGASASATDLSSGADTRVVKWPSTLTSCLSNCPLAGESCSTSDLLAGAEATRVISRQSNHYACR